MKEPLVVPGHPVDNPHTDDYWPRLQPDLAPVFEIDDGTPLGPYRAKKASWILATSSPDSPDPLVIDDPDIAVTDRRVIALGQPGRSAPPDRRLMTQFHHVCCLSIEYLPRRLAGPATIVLNGLVDDDGEVGPAVLALQFGVATDVLALTRELLHRVARQYLRMDLVGDRMIDAGLDEKQYVGAFAHASIDEDRKGGAYHFPRGRMIRFGEDYRRRGEAVRDSMIDCNLSAESS